MYLKLCNYNSEPSCIHDCLLGDREATKGYRFVYEENLLPRKVMFRYLDLEKLKPFIDPDDMYLANPAHVADPERLLDRMSGRTPSSIDAILHKTHWSLFVKVFFRL